MCDCFGGDSDDVEVVQAVASINDEMNSTDSFPTTMLAAELKKAIQQRDRSVDSSMIEFPPPFEVDKDAKVDMNCFSERVRLPSTQKNRFQMPKVDEYFGDFGLFDDVCHYGKYSDGFFASSFDEKGDPPSKADWESLGLQKSAETEARNYFQGTIAKPLYEVEDMNRLQRDEKGNAPNNNEYLRNKQLNDWEEVDIHELKNKNQVLSSLLSDTFTNDRDKEDMWLTLIAFTGYGAHRTSPYSSNEEHQGAFFVNDVTFLSQYQVRKGFETYGAAAYFDQKYQLREIYLSDTDTTYKSPDRDEGSRVEEWKHARWAWKVSVSVAVFIVDNLCHTRFRESNGLLTSIQAHLNPDHALRRLLIPFTLGTVYANRVYNELLRENGLFHRCFAFKYKELQRLIRESMEDAPEAEKNKRRDAKDKMKYRFRLLRKRVLVMKKLPDTIYPIYTDVYDFWVQTLKFVEEYVEVFYNDSDEKELMKDKEAEAFYHALCTALGVKDRYRFKKFNIINILTHFICKATVWAHHLNTAVSFEYSMDVDFTGVKIIGNNSKQNNISSYVEYCLMVLATGWKNNNLMDPDGDWKVVLQDIDGDAARAGTVFDTYFKALKKQSDRIRDHSKLRIAPYYAIDPVYCQSSMCL